ncbi:MAG: DASH family cryptochrome [Flavobacteriales bacterium]|nr:DASH family cryptochrome [Flavobacteriales bacterium]
MSKSQQKISVVWFTTNLRIHDNLSLNQAIESNQSVVGLYILDSNIFDREQFGFRKTGKFRANFILESLRDLREQLAKLNIPLAVYQCDPISAFQKLESQFPIATVYHQAEWTSEELHSIAQAQQALGKQTSFIQSYSQFLFHPDDIPFRASEIPEVFTEYRKACEKSSKPRLTIEPQIPSAPSLSVKHDEIPSLGSMGYDPIVAVAHSAFPFKGGESAAIARLEDYVTRSKKVGVYKKTRNGLVGVDYSSKFSPWLAAGALSPRTIYETVKQFETDEFSNQSTYWLIFELIWRDYFKYISLKHRDKIFRRSGIRERHYEWDSDRETIIRWTKGETPDEFVNANMIELAKTGWMSNRGRQNVASYFAKQLKLDWRIGAAYFESLLLDYDVHSNYGNWMYVSGVGNDPRDRKFNTKLQADRYDPTGQYRRLWLQPTLF